MTKIVHIRWQDAAALTGWRSKKAVKNLIKHPLTACETVGMLVHESDEKVIIVHTVGEEEFSGLFEIPKGCIESIKVLAKLPVKLNLK